MFGTRYPPEIKERVEELYIQQSMNTRQIRVALKKEKIDPVPSRQSINDWIKDGKFTERRKKVVKKTIAKREDLWVLDRIKTTEKLQKIIDKAVKEFYKGKVRTNLGDIERLLNLVMKINGINLDQTNVTVNNNTNEISVKAILLQVAEARKKLDENKPLMEMEK